MLFRSPALSQKFCKAFSVAFEMFGRWLRFLKAPAAAGAGSGRVPPVTADATGEHAAQLQRAADLFERGQFDEAVGVLKRLLDAQHDFADAHFLLGLIEKRRGDPEAAADCFVLATTFRPDFADAWCQLAAGEIARGDIEGARRTIARALESDPGHAEGHAMAARLCESEKQFGSAIEH